MSVLFSVYGHFLFIAYPVTVRMSSKHNDHPVVDVMGSNFSSLFAFSRKAYKIQNKIHKIHTYAIQKDTN